VPVLTFSGDRWVGRISRSILAAAGLGEWVEASIGGYIRRAIDLAVSRRTSRRLEHLRENMRERLRNSAACDSEGLCRELERHYRSLANREQG
jgi:predicted O-linked N-acetylglucosamine transferase (SPINDLY family)